ncbi:hypothetical protein PM082_018817 [Marasmius tenuissimus]|nr:hypothetical protein PM082_018817 [Marasmius tenuissimus]
MDRAKVLEPFEEASLVLFDYSTDNIDNGSQGVYIGPSFRPRISGCRLRNFASVAGAFVYPRHGVVNISVGRASDWDGGTPAASLSRGLGSWKCY